MLNEVFGRLMVFFISNVTAELSPERQLLYHIPRACVAPRRTVWSLPAGTVPARNHEGLLFPMLKMSGKESIEQPAMPGISPGIAGVRRSDSV
jgi:hypothetical protein